jgi:hypothetical protein
MPLVKGKSGKAIRENIEIEEKIGHRKPKRAVAIAMNEAAKTSKKKPAKKAAKKKVSKRK